MDPSTRRQDVRTRSELRSRLSRRDLVGSAALGALASHAWISRAATGGETQLTWGIHASLVPTWFDPAETQGIVSPFMVLYAIHDALAKPMPGQSLAPSLAESFSVADDGLAYDFALRIGAVFHNGDPVTAEDVKFSFERYRGAARHVLHERVTSVETLDVAHVRFRLREPWPDFLTYCMAVTGAGWIVPKAYVEKVGDEGFRKAPVGAGPYRFVSFKPGVGLVFEAFEQYWRKPPSVPRLIFRVIPDATTRLAALKRGDIDIAYRIDGELAREVQRTPGLALQAIAQGTNWVEFPEQWDARSPWHDPKLRLAVSRAIDRDAINQALYLGGSHVTGSIIPDDVEFYWSPPPPLYDPVEARRLLAEAGYANGLDAGDYCCLLVEAHVGEAVVDNLREVGIRAKLRPLETAAFIKAWTEKKLKNIIQGTSGAPGNAATRLEQYAVKGGTFVNGSYPDIDELFRQQAVELDHTRREALLHRVQQLIHERAMHAAILQPAFVSATGPRVGHSSLGRLAEFPYTAPYEDITLSGA